jgi:uncharacterized protein HemX
MSEWFDPADARFQSANQAINDLLAIEVQVEVPDITAPWSTLRLLRGSQSEPTPPPPVADGTPGEISVEVPVDESASEDDGE